MNSIRIISGTHKGRRVKAPKQLPARPTTDIAKESLFNILNNHYYFEDILVLDLYSGTGNISYEFASRGTENITAVDQNVAAIKFINQTSESFEFPIRTIKSEVIKFLENHQGKYNVIFADPPYAEDIELLQKIKLIVFEKEFLLHNGMLIIEHSKLTDLSETLDFKYAKSYGSSTFSFFSY